MIVQQNKDNASVQVEPSELQHVKAFWEKEYKVPDREAVWQPHKTQHYHYYGTMSQDSCCT
jgi:hypothetical protein